MSLLDTELLWEVPLHYLQTQSLVQDLAEIIEVITDFGLGGSTGLIPLCCGMIAPTGFIERCRRRQR